MCRYAQFTLSSRQLNYRGFPLIFLKKLNQNSYALLYFSYNIKNAPVIDDFEWKFFAVIVICSRIIAFSPSGKPGAIITRQFIDTAWTNWTLIK